MIWFGVYTFFLIGSFLLFFPLFVVLLFFAPALLFLPKVPPNGTIRRDGETSLHGRLPW